MCKIWLKSVYLGLLYKYTKYNNFVTFCTFPSLSSLARDSICAIARYIPSPVRPSVCPSITRVDQSKTVEVRITQPSPQSSSMTLVS